MRTPWRFLPPQASFGGFNFRLDSRGRSLLLIFFFYLLLFSQLGVSHGDVTVSSCADLNKAIERVNKGDKKVGIISIPRRTTVRLSPCSGLTRISKDITIRGAGSPIPTITGQNLFSLFNLGAQGVNLTLSNLVLSSGVASNGGCVSISNFSRGIFSSVTFQNCSANEVGGAIFSNGSISLSSVKFVFNRANIGGAIWTSGSLDIRNSKFTSNSAYNGGAIYSEGSITLNTSSLNSNSATMIGGAIYINSNKPTSILNSKFNDNFFEGYIDPVSGGAIYSLAPLRIERSHFVRNIGNSDSTAEGGALYLAGPTSISNSRFLENRVQTHEFDACGGAIKSINFINITSSEFSKNDASSSEGLSCGGAVSLNRFSRISRSSFSQNSLALMGFDVGAERRGGAIYSELELISQNNIFSNNSIKSINSRGGAIYTFKLTASFTTFELNRIVGYDVSGGAAYVVSDAVFQHCFFISNSVISQGSTGGGAIASTGFLTIFNSSFNSNSATSECTESCDPSVSGGGAIFNTYGSIIQRSTFRLNFHESKNLKTVSSGGAIYFPSTSSKSQQISSSIFEFNSAISSFGTARGGAVSMYSFSGVSSIIGAKFLGNSALGSISNGGAVFLQGRKFLSSNCTFTGNSANASAGDANGGALALFGQQDANPVLFATFVRNRAVSQSKGFAKGGAIYQGYSLSLKLPVLPLAYAVFDGNTAIGKNGARGGSLYLKANQSLECSYSSFSNSSASADIAEGGAIYAANYSSLSFCKGNFFNTNNRIVVTGKTPKRNVIFTGFLCEVNYCPNPVPQDPDFATFSPKLNCGGCDCTLYFNPCDPRAKCQHSTNPASTTCVCPSNAPGNGFKCGA